MDTRTKGNLGEDIACSYIKGQGFEVIERNYRKKYGEIDVIASREGQIHFFEVKSVTGFGSNTKVGLLGNYDVFRPEDNVHSLKVRHIRKMVETYFMENIQSSDMPFQFHVICVFMNMKTHRARIKWLKNIIL